MGNHRGQMGNHRNQMGNHRDQMGNNREQMGNHRDQMSSHRGQMGSHRGQFGGNQGSSGSNRAHGPMAITNDCRYPLNSRNYQDTEWNHNRNNKNNDQKEKKPKELYIPPEENEEELFNGGISSGINFVNYDNIPVKVNGENIPLRIKSFMEFDLNDVLMQNIDRLKYTVPTPIQKVAIPLILKGRDIMACAQTGSGKTAAFLLPILNDLLSQNYTISIGKPLVIIISPTRELALQTYSAAIKFCYGSFLNIRVVYGGTSTHYQSDKVLQCSCHVLICTPGRLIDFVNRGFIDFTLTRYMVLDEADRMLDLGFKDDIGKIMGNSLMPTAPERQTLMFSATFPDEIQKLAGKYLTNYDFIAIGVVGSACSDVVQQILEVPKRQKRGKLLDLLQEDANGTIVFVETKRSADFLASILSETEFPTTSIHGDRLQRQREEALYDFKSGKMKVLIATSVAARGLDIKNVRHVINYDLPQTIDEYVHRIGRTGRVGNSGRSTTFFDPDNDTALAKDLVKILQLAGQPVPEFLNAYDNTNHYLSFVSPYSGRDVRASYKKQDDNGINLAGPCALEEEESWD